MDEISSLELWEEVKKLRQILTKTEQENAKLKAENRELQVSCDDFIEQCSKLKAQIKCLNKKLNPGVHDVEEYYREDEEVNNGTDNNINR